MTSNTPPNFRSGFVTLAGRPNAGKSTLANALVGTKVAITSSAPQTTRHRLRAILTTDQAQIIFVDTPGLHRPKDALGEEVNKSTYKALEDTDLSVLLIDSTRPLGKGDIWVFELLKTAAKGADPLVLLTKTDIATAEQIEAQRSALAAFTDVEPLLISATEGTGTDQFVEAVTALLPTGPLWFPPDVETDQPFETLIAEFIREKILRTTFDEVPHAIGIRIDELDQDLKRDLTKIEATIFVERDSQKGIIIGKKGAGIKAIGIDARHDLETLLGTRVFLDLRVKVKKNWRKDAAQIRRFGYGEGV
ncbi:MAG: GTPase Era [Coriobacteriia bacterium]|nr:GTPase Era [Coriobacteriia bacterium]MCL2536901.1 GTPase Era [Coriobacteriia bacterium]